MQDLDCEKYLIESQLSYKIDVPTNVKFDFFVIRAWVKGILKQKENTTSAINFRTENIYGLDVYSSEATIPSSTIVSHDDQHKSVIIKKEFPTSKVKNEKVTTEDLAILFKVKNISSCYDPIRESFKKLLTELPLKYKTVTIVDKEKKSQKEVLFGDFFIHASANFKKSAGRKHGAVSVKIPSSLLEYSFLQVFPQLSYEALNKYFRFLVVKSLIGVRKDSKSQFILCKRDNVQSVMETLFENMVLFHKNKEHPKLKELPECESVEKDSIATSIKRKEIDQEGSDQSNVKRKKQKK